MLHWGRWSALTASLVLVVPSLATAGVTRVHGAAVRHAPHHGVGPTGKFLSTRDGGQIFGFDINQTGNDGVLASSQTINSNGLNRISVETFDETTGAIVKVLAAAKTMSDYVVDGIFAGDVALLDHEVVPPHSIFAIRHYRVMNPVTGGAFTSKWTPPIKDLSILGTAENQVTTTSIAYALALHDQDDPVLVVSDVATNTFSKVFKLDPNQFFQSMQPQFAQDTQHDAAVFATSPSSGAAGGPPPLIGTIDLKTGKVNGFTGAACPGLPGCGSAAGIGYDSNTGIACTTTVIDGGVEFYTIATHNGVHEFFPGSEGELFAGGYVATDTIHKLFLIAQPFSSTAPGGSSIQVFDEGGNFVESVDGLNFTNAGSLVIQPKVAINPSTRIGWVNGPGVNQLQQFAY